MQKEIQLKDILILLLKKFRPIFLTALLLALVFGGTGAWRGYRSVTDSAVVEQQKTAYLMKKNEFESSVSQLRADLDRAEKRHQELQEYTRQSVYYNMDSSNEAICELVFYVDTGFQIIPDQFYQSPNKTSDIVSAYCDAYRSSTLYTGLSEIIGEKIEAKYIDELIQVERAGDTKIKDNLGNITVRHSDINNGLVIIRTRHQDEKIAAGMADFIFESLKTTVTQSVAAHETNVITNSTMRRIDDDLNLLRHDSEKELTDLNTKLVTKRAELQQKERSTPVPPTFSKSALLKKGLLYAIAGGVIGGVLACGWILLVTFSDNRLGGVAELKRLYALELLGVFQTEGSKRGKTAKPLLFHKLIARLEGRTEQYPSAEQVTDYVNTALAVLTASAGEKRTVLLTGTADPTHLREYGKRLENTSGAVTYLLGESILESGETVSLLCQADGVVLIEQAGYSLLPRMNEEILRIESLGKKIFGIILIA